MFGWSKKKNKFDKPSGEFNVGKLILTFYLSDGEKVQHTIFGNCEYSEYSGKVYITTAFNNLIYFIDHMSRNKFIKLGNEYYPADSIKKFSHVEETHYLKPQ